MEREHKPEGTRWIFPTAISNEKLKKRKKMYENSHRPTKGKSADSRFNTIRETPQCVP